MYSPDQIAKLTPEQRQAEIERVKGLIAQGHTTDPTVQPMPYKQPGILPSAIIGGLRGFMGQDPMAGNDMGGIQNILAKQAIENQDPYKQAQLKLANIKLEKAGKPTVVPEGFEVVSYNAEGDPMIKKIDQEKTRKQAEENIASPISDSPEDKATWLSQLSPRDASLVKAVTDYNYDIFRGLSFKDRERIGALATMYDPTFSMAEFNARQKYKQETTYGKIGANIRSYNTVLGHFGSLQDVTENQDLPSNPIKLIEKGERGFANQFQSGGSASKAMADENSAITAVAGELANVFKNSGGTDQEIHSWFQSYDKDASREYKQQWIKKGAELLESRMGAIGYDYERVMGKPYEQDILSPKAKETLTRIKGKASLNNTGNSGFKIVASRPIGG